MKKGQKKKQDKALKKRTKEKLSHKRERALGAVTALYQVRHARNYPIEGCWAQKDWQSGEGGLAVVVVARRQPNGNIVFGNYLVDVLCLGLKDTYCNADIPASEFRHDALPHIYRSAGPPMSISPALAHEIVYGGIEYAAKFGFQPQRDFRDSQWVLDPPETHPRSGKVEFGKDGKPLFISGPYDNAEAIVRQLIRTAGEGNFNYLMMLGEPPDDF
ncbi:MAG: hypothetical protein HYZ49_08120 [Chloroflexi bacterium]|nr:hypothetical protein [Chloroflexota bacterium]